MDILSRCLIIESGAGGQMEPRGQLGRAEGSEAHCLQEYDWWWS